MSEIGIKDQCFGVEVEMTGIIREQAAHALADYFGTSPQYLGTGYDTWGATDPEGKIWKLMSDASIRAERKTRTGYTSNAGTSYRVEMVTPKLTYAELPKFQECIRRVRAAGAKVNSSCGIHVHVDAANHNRQSLKNLIGIMYSKRGHSVQGITGKRVPCFPMVPEGAGTYASAGQDIVLRRNKRSDPAGEHLV